MLSFLAQTYLTSAITADEAGGFQNLLFLLLLTPQVSEGVYDDTEDEVEDDDDDHEEEEQVVYHSGGKQRLLSRRDTWQWATGLTSRFLTWCKIILFIWKQVVFRAGFNLAKCWWGQWNRGRYSRGLGQQTVNVASRIDPISTQCMLNMLKCYHSTNWWNSSGWTHRTCWSWQRWC